jgi:hypothetical protein
MHNSLDIEFLLAIIDSWDGDAPGPVGPDYFHVVVNGQLVFRHTFTNYPLQYSQTYAPPSGGLLSSGTNRGYAGDPDSAYNMYLEPTLHNIPHTASTAVIDFFAGGGGWQGGFDESWGIDNLRVSANFSPSASPVPEPGSLALWGIGGLSSLVIAAWRRRRKS